MKKAITYFLLLPIACCMFVIGCYSPRHVYSPAATNVPVFTKKADSKLAAAYSNSAYGSKNGKKLYNFGFDAQAAYALCSHWLVFLNQSNRYEKSSGNFQGFNYDSSTILYKRRLTEIGGGYFNVVKDSGKLYFQLLGGLGFGKFKLDDNGKDFNSGFYSRYHQTGVTKLFIQPAIQIRYSKNFRSSFASRFIILWYHNIKTDYSVLEQQQYLLDGLTSSPRTFWEPAVINNFSFNKLPAVQFELQFGIAALISKRFIDYRSVNISVGAILDINKLKNNRK